MIYPNEKYLRAPITPPTMSVSRLLDPKQIRLNILRRNLTINHRQLRIETSAHGKVLVFTPNKTL